MNNEFGIGAQFVSEIQGGAAIPSNLLEAVPEGNCYRLYGTKFFTSAVHADYAVVTAKISGSEDIGAFIVPAWMPGDKEKEIRLLKISIKVRNVNFVGVSIPCTI